MKFGLLHLFECPVEKSEKEVLLVRPILVQQRIPSLDLSF